MSQNVQLHFTGENTSENDFEGLPPGSLSIADNVECRFKNLGEPRRGFSGLTSSQIVATYLARLTDFFITGVSKVLGLSSAGNYLYYNGAGWTAIPGNVCANILPPNSASAKSRFLTAGQNMYLTAADGIRSLSSGSGSNCVIAGVPKGLNLSGVTDIRLLTGFLSNNVILSTTGNITGSDIDLKDLVSTVGVATGLYIAGVEVKAALVVQDITYTAVLFGVLGNAITIAYTVGGTAGNEVVTVVSNAISVQIESGVSTATQINAKVLASAAALLLVTPTISGTAGAAQVAAVATHLAGGLDNTIPSGTTVSSITPSAPIAAQTGDTASGVAQIENLASIAGIAVGTLVTGTGLQDNSYVTGTSGGGPYTVTLSGAPFLTATGTIFTFSSPIIVKMSAAAVTSLTGTPITFYAGSQVGYQMVFGRVETNLNTASNTRLGTPSSLAVVTNVSPYSANVTVTGTIPKNSSQSIGFVQLYRSNQTTSIDVPPPTQYKLVYERALVAGDFTARTITITDIVTDALRGIPLYSGSDQETATQANDPPPVAWDMCTFRDFAIYGNVTYPGTFKFTILAVGSPNGLQSGDTITIAGTFSGVSFTKTYTGGSSEVPASRQFKVYSAGSAAQNVADTARSFISVLNYDNACPVHAIYLSTVTDLAGQILLEADNPSLDTFTTTASAHMSAYDPALTGVVSTVNVNSNGIGISKSGELEAVPRLNFLSAGNSSSPVLRVIPQREYVVVIKSDGVYKLQGTSPNALTINTWDLTVKIIGPDTAVALDSSVWMLSTQGVVSISDGGTQLRSIPIDDQLNALIGQYLSNLNQSSFGMAYESDRKYILCVPTSSATYAQLEYNFNYTTNAWTTWSRNFYFGFIHSSEDRIYVARADASNQSVSVERDSRTYADYVDESFVVTITVVNGTLITLSSVTGITAGDVLYQSASIWGNVVSVDTGANTLIVTTIPGFTAAAATILASYLCNLQFKPVFGDNPAYVRQYAEGIILFKAASFTSATLKFLTDYSASVEDVAVTGPGLALWGYNGWGDFPWGGSVVPSKIRFYVPQEKQMGSYIIPGFTVQQGYASFLFQGLSMSYENQSQEVGL